MFCPKCRAEYKEGVTECGECGVSLVAILPEKPAHEGQKDIDFVSIVRTFNPQDIAIIRSILDGSGIEYYIQGEEGVLVRPLVDPANVMVVKDQAADAIELLKDLDLSFYMFKPDHHEENEPDDGSSK
jgi:Putative prokaryotic signal transducing protein